MKFVLLTVQSQSLALIVYSALFQPNQFYQIYLQACNIKLKTFSFYFSRAEEGAVTRRAGVCPQQEVHLHRKGVQLPAAAPPPRAHPLTTPTPQSPLAPPPPSDSILTAHLTAEVNLTLNPAFTTVPVVPTRHISTTFLPTAVVHLHGRETTRSRPIQTKAPSFPAGVDITTILSHPLSPHITTLNNKYLPVSDRKQWNEIQIRT